MARPQAVLLAALLAAVPPAGAAAAPVFEVAVGGTAAILGDYDQGGVALGGAVLWPLEAAPVRFGVMAHADDLGARIVPIADANDGTPLGRIEAGHRATWGAAWRLDALLPAVPDRVPLIGGWRPEAGGTWGYYRVADDVRGSPTRSLGTTGFGLGAGIGRPLGRVAFAFVVRYHRLFNDVTGRYVTGAVAWRWGGAPSR